MLARQARHVPFSLQRRVIERLMNQTFREPLDEGDFEFLEGRWMQVEILDLGLSWYFSAADSRLLVSNTESADAAIRGNLKEFLLLANRSEDPDTLFFQRRLRIDGDTELGLEVKNLMDSIDHDAFPPLLKRALEQGAALAQRLL